MTMRVAIVQGTRPEIIKNSPLVEAFTDRGITHLVFHTNQHYLPEMRDKIYANFDYEADFVMPGVYQLGRAISWLQECFQRERITHVVVNGDTAASLAGAVAALYSDIPLSHIEAGLRARDRFMLEERNRIMVDSLASLLFAYTSYEADELSKSRDIRGSILVEGNTTVDVLEKLKPEIDATNTPEEPYAFVTLHRRELTDSFPRMILAVEALNRIANNHCHVKFPVHPRTSEVLDRYRLRDRISRYVELLEPLDFLETLRLENRASVIVTDSGCIQEEAYLLGVPCVTMRDNTERPLTVSNGANAVSGFDPSCVDHLVRKAIASPRIEFPEIYGTVGVGPRIVSRIEEFGIDRSRSPIPIRSGRKRRADTAFG